MNVLKSLVALLAVIPLAGFAAAQNNAEQVTCSGTQTTDMTNGLQIDCVGSLTIYGGSLTSDGDIKLTASDVLDLEAVTLTTTKNIILIGNGVSIGRNVAVNANHLFATNIVNNGIISQSGVLPTCVNTIPSSATISVGGWVDPNPNFRQQVCSLTGINSDQVVSTSLCQATDNNPPIFKIIEVGTRYCSSGKTRYHQVRFLRAEGAACHTLPSTVELAPTQDFSMGSTTERTAQCSDTGATHSSCLLYDAINGSATPIQPSAGRVDLTWSKNGNLQKVEGRIIEQTSADCHSESTLKFIKKM
jgi:hypothetical protein